LNASHVANHTTTCGGVKSVAVPYITTL
jgi:hypothetical protein